MFYCIFCIYTIKELINKLSLGRDSSKSETLETQTERSMSQPTVQESKSADTLIVDDMKYSMPPKSSSNKSLRKSKLVSDFEVVPEDVEAVIKTQTKRKNPPRPLDLNLRQVMPIDLPSLLQSPI